MTCHIRVKNILKALTWGVFSKKKMKTSYLYGSINWHFKHLEILGCISSTQFLQRFFILEILNVYQIGIYFIPSTYL
jgi:hypothetical protein